MIYQISSGQGPAECELGVAKFLAYLQKYYKISVLETSQGYYENTYRSVRIQTDADLSQFVGSVQWVCPSPYRIGHNYRFVTGGRSFLGILSGQIVVTAYMFFVFASGKSQGA